MLSTSRILFGIPIFLVLILTRTALCASETYHVATNGRDSNPGTESRPFRTINRGVAALKPGDKLYVKTGTYREALINNIPGGTSWSNPVTVAVFPGHQVTIKAPAGSDRVLEFGESSQRYIIIDGFIIDGVNAQQEVIKISQDHIRIQNTEIKNLASPIGVWVVAGDPTGTVGCCNEFINLNLHDTGSTETPDSAGLLIGSADNLVERSLIHSNWGPGIVLWNDFNSANNNIIHNNKIFNNGRGGLSGEALWITRGSGNLAYNNLIFGNPAGISVGYQSYDAKLYNNTVYGNGAYGLFIDSNDGSFNTQVKNNIFHKNGSENGNNIQDYGTDTVLLKNLETDPLFVDPVNGDFRLQATSVAIDAGVDISEVRDDYAGIPRPQGVAYDIGAHEFIGNAASFNFSLSNGGNKSVSPGELVSNSVTATLSSGTPQAVSFSTSGLPKGATASYSPTSCNPTCSTTLSIAASASTPTGTYPVTVTGTGGGATRTTSFELTVDGTAPSFNFSLSNGGNKSLSPGESVSNTITATLSSGTPQAVSFSTSGLPKGATASYSPTSCNPTCSTTLTIAASASTPTGTYPVTVTGTGGGITKTTSFDLTVNGTAPTFNFSLSNGGNKSVTQGQSVSNDITATISSVLSQAVSFSTSGVPTGATTSYSQTACNPTCSTTLTIATSASTPTGTYPVTVTGTGGGITKTTNFDLTVNGTAGGVLDVIWTDNSDNEDGFRIERKTGTTGTFTLVGTVGANVTSYTDSGLVIGTTYCYRVSAFNSSGNSPYSDEACGVARLP